MGYTRQAIMGTSWVALLRFATRFLTLLRISILARIFTPLEFGLYGIAAIVLSLIEILTETGINVFLIQETNNTNKYINTAWIVSILRGSLITAAIIILSPLIVLFFNAPNSLHLLLLISIVPFIRGFINPAIAFYQKDLKFKNEFYFKFFIFLIEFIVVVTTALITQAVYSIVVGMIVGVFVEVILSFIAISPKPTFRYESKYIREVIQRGKWITLAGVFNYLFHNANDILVGKILGSYSLGLYQMAYKISIFPITEISDVTSKVAFPVYVKIANDRNRLKKAFFKTLSLVGVLSILFGIILIIFTKEIVFFVLGEKWLAILPFLKILAVFGVVRGISGSTSALFLAVKKQKYVSVVTFISFVALVIIVVPFIGWGGLVGASISILIASIIVLPVMIYYTFQVLYAKS